MVCAYFVHRFDCVQLDLGQTPVVILDFIFLIVVNTGVLACSIDSIQCLDYLLCWHSTANCIYSLGSTFAQAKKRAHEREKEKG